MRTQNVYQRSRCIVRNLGPVVSMIRKRDKGLADQLRRAAQSMVLNIAEARGSDDGNAKARFATACGSAKETRAALHVAADWGYASSEVLSTLDEELDIVCAITWVLAHRR